jgi:uncharacterized protein YraI
MPGIRLNRPLIRPRALLVATLALMTFVFAPALGQAPSTTPQPGVYAVTDLNMRKGPGGTDALFTVVPRGGQVTRTADPVTNDYARVTYNGITGWVVALGLVGSPAQIDPAPPVETPVDTPLELYSPDTRVTLTPLLLRSGPELSAEPITGMPEGSLVTLTREGWENGYVTVDYGGAQGWAYADLLAEPAEAEALSASA